MFEKLKPALLTPTDHQECSDKILEICKAMDVTSEGERSEVFKLSGFMDTLRQLEF